MSNLIVVNMFGGPGSGKSTTATGAFSRLKIAGVNAEYVSEYAKDLTWSKRSLENQTLILGKQYDRLLRLKDQVDVVLTDSPLLLVCLYNRGYESLSRLAMDLYGEFWNLNFFVERKKAYNPAGRVQTEQEAQALDFQTSLLLSNHELPFDRVPGTEFGIEHVVQRTLIELARAKQVQEDVALPTGNHPVTREPGFTLSGYGY